MKKIVLFIILSCFLISCSQKTIEADISQKQERNGLVYIINSNKPFTGKIIEKYDNGQVANEINYKNGKRHGFITSYYKNGQPLGKNEWENGLRVGEVKMWDEDGNIKSYGKFKDNGELHIIYYNKDGSERERAITKDGKRIDKPAQ